MSYSCILPIPRGTWMSGLRSRPPASIKSTRAAPSSLSRLASTQPADPPPTITKSWPLLTAMRAARLWHDSSAAKSHIERAGDEQFLELDPPRAQPLLVHVFGDRFEHRAGCLEAISQRIVVGQHAVDALIEQSCFEIPLQMGLAVARDFLLRRHECRIKVECEPGMALEQRAPHHDRMVDRKQAGLCVKAPAFGGGIGEEVTRHPRDIDRAAVDQIGMDEIEQRPVELPAQ